MMGECTMYKQLISYIKHRINVYTWERAVKADAKFIALICGVEVGSYEYKMILRDVANGDISKNDIIAQ